MEKFDFNKFAKQPYRHSCSPVNLLHFFRTPFPETISGRLLLSEISKDVSVNNDLLKGL